VRFVTVRFRIFEPLNGAVRCGAVQVGNSTVRCGSRARFKMRIKPEHGILLNTHVLAHFVFSEEPGEAGEAKESEGDREDEAERLKSNQRGRIPDNERRALPELKPAPEH
jgi:hypothetical protein